MEILDDTPYWGLTARAEKGVKLLKGSTFTPVPGFPAGHTVNNMAVFQGKLYALNHSAQKNRVWRTDGQTKAEAVSGLDGVQIRVLKSSPSLILAGGSDAQGGALWQSHDGMHWTVRQRFPSVPIDIVFHEDSLFVGTYADEGGALWGRDHPLTLTPSPINQLPKPNSIALKEEMIQRKLQRLDTLLQLKELAQLRQELLPLITSLGLTRNPEVGKALSQRLSTKIPEKQIPLFGGIQVNSRKLVLWYLLYGVAVNGYGVVPQELIQEPWSAKKKSG